MSFKSPSDVNTDSRSEMICPKCFTEGLEEHPGYINDYSGAQEILHATRCPTESCPYNSGQGVPAHIIKEQYTTSTSLLPSKQTLSVLTIGLIVLTAILGFTLLGLPSPLQNTDPTPPVETPTNTTNETQTPTNTTQNNNNTNNPEQQEPDPIDTPTNEEPTENPTEDNPEEEIEDTEDQSTDESEQSTENTNDNMDDSSNESNNESTEENPPENEPDPIDTPTNEEPTENPPENEPVPIVSESVLIDNTKSTEKIRIDSVDVESGIYSVHYVAIPLCTSEYTTSTNIPQSFSYGYSTSSADVQLADSRTTMNFTTSQTLNPWIRPAEPDSTNSTVKPSNLPTFDDKVTISSVQLSSDTINIGDSVRITATFTNTRSDPVSTPIVISVNGQIRSQSQEFFGSGEQKEMTFSTRFTDAGKYTIMINNDKSIPITVGEPHNKTDSEDPILTRVVITPVENTSTTQD